jgi:hypothetical protein
MITSTNPVTPPDLVDRIRELVAACGPASSRNDRAIIAIVYCISEGIDAKDHIVKSLKRAGFKASHAAKLLDDCEGAFPESHHWRLGADGRYSLHEDEAVGGQLNTRGDGGRHAGARVPRGPERCPLSPFTSTGAPNRREASTPASTAFGVSS